MYIPTVIVCVALVNALYPTSDYWGCSIEWSAAFDRAVAHMHHNYFAKPGAYTVQLWQSKCSEFTVYTGAWPQGIPSFVDVPPRFASA